MDSELRDLKARYERLELLHQVGNVIHSSNVRSELAVPFEVNGEVCGVLNVDSDRVGAFAENDERLLQELAVQAAKAIHQAWMKRMRLFPSVLPPPMELLCWALPAQLLSLTHRLNHPDDPARGSKLRQ